MANSVGRLLDLVSLLAWPPVTQQSVYIDPIQLPFTSFQRQMQLCIALDPAAFSHTQVD